MFNLSTGIFALAKRGGVAVLIAAIFAPGSAIAQASPSSASLGDQAEKPLTLKEAAQEAVLSSPEVLARWHTIKAATGERDAAKGALLPRLDITAATGPERRSDLGSNRLASSSLTLTQLLYDGFATRNEVQRLDHTARVRLLEFFDTSESVALEVARAYFDVMRYRELVRLAEENFVEHRAVFAQTDSRVKARVARGVDLEQVSGRLALAEANLLTETANLHDTTARFQRLVGHLPTREMPLPAHLTKDIPSDTAAALSRSQERNPTLLAAVESVRASQAAVASRSGAFGPRIDVRLKRDQSKNQPGLPGSFSSNAAEVVLSWNLFNGGGDRARERQFAEQVNVAKDLRDKTCRDIRQTLVIAYNDVKKLNDQIEYLQLHEASIGRALVAYRQQFDIGQRTLLDLLDTENELFQAKRAVVNARHDLNIAYARTQAGLGNLLQSLDIASLKPELESQLPDRASDDDAARDCPPEPVTIHVVDKDALVARVLERNRRVLQPAVPEAVGRERAEATSAKVGSSGEAAIKEALENWRKAWASRDIAAYLLAYSPGFAPANGASRATWAKSRGRVLAGAVDVSIDLSGLALTMGDPDHATTGFVQTYKSATYRDTVTKILNWERVNGKWLIVSEIARK